MDIHYFSPCGGTSKGHSAIQMAVRDAITEHIPGLRFRPCQSLSDTSMDAEVGILVVDFPDIASWPQLCWFIKNHPRWRTIYLSMNANLEYIRQVSDGNRELPIYDTVVSLEPGAGRLCSSDEHKHRGYKIISADFMIAPLIRPFSRMQTAFQIIHPSALYITSGYPEEIARMKDLAAQHLARHGYPAYTLADIQAHENVRPSSSIVRPISFACDERFVRIYSPPGYSGFWELHAAGLLRKTRWLMTTRPVENVVGRTMLATTEKSDTLNGSKAGLALSRDPLGYCEHPEGLNQLSAIIEAEVQALTGGMYDRRTA